MLVGSLALAGGAILDGCAPDSGSVGGKTPIRIGHQSAVAMRAVFMEATGYAARTMGVPVSFSLMASGPATVQAFAQEQLDIAYLGPVPALIGIDKGVALQVVAAAHWYGYSLVGQAGQVKTLDELGGDRKAAAKQFQGKIVGAFAKGSTQDVICRHFFSEAGMTEGRDYTIRNYSGPDAIQLLRAGAVFGFVEFFENVAIAVQEGYVPIVQGAQLWPGLDNVIVVRRGFLDGNRDLVRRFLAVDADVAEFQTAYPAEYARLSAPALKMTEDDAIRRVGYDTHYCPSPTDAAMNAVYDLVPTMRAMGYMTSDPDRAAVTDLDIVRGVAGPGVSCSGKAEPDAALHQRILGR
jgi:ABC-type nitrate/sulfonate/bicarbonate transport system substrate-binding protein